MHDRRKHQRFLLEQSCFLTSAASVGTILDLCMGGLLSCMCLEDNRCSNDSQQREVDIFCKTAKLSAQGLPIKVLDSNTVSGEFDMGLSCRKCRVQFEHLELNQKAHLEEIILSHTILSTR
ncbi:MAG: PilZ domain-containing protein [Desulfocapsa sp.]|nr:PilZ domain-containing protein [Desulfocapsa sp.]